MKIVEANPLASYEKTYIETESGEKIYFDGICDGMKKAYECGLNEAWEAAKELFTEEKKRLCEQQKHNKSI